MKIKKEKKYQTNLVHKVLQVSLKTTGKKETNEKIEENISVMRTQVFQKGEFSLVNCRIY